MYKIRLNLLRRNLLIPHKSVNSRFIHVGPNRSFIRSKEDEKSVFGTLPSHSTVNKSEKLDSSKRPVNNNVKGNNVSRVLNNVMSLKRGSTDICSNVNIRKLDIQEGLKVFNKKNNQNITLQDISNNVEIIETFLYRGRPTIEIPDIEIIYETVDGEGLGFFKSQYSVLLKEKYTAVVVPKTVVGDIVKVQLMMHHYHCADSTLVEIQKKSDKRNNELIKCSKFDDCKGCQFQMLPYDEQLKYKRNVIKRAFQFFYPEILDQVEIGKVQASPKEYHYRTKLTPHYNWNNKLLNTQDYKVNIGFDNVNPTRPTVDVDYCHIATDTINKDLPKLRQQINDKLFNGPKQKKKNQATSLLRESIVIDFKTGQFNLTTITKNNELVTEKVEDLVYQFPANEFFQTNNAILPVILNHIRKHLKTVDYSNIIDTYCGSGFFGIALARDIPPSGKVFGVEISAAGIKYATHNAKINGLSVPENVSFLSGTADTIFTNTGFMKAGIKGKDSIVIMDPSRKGSNLEFLKQLLDFEPKLIIYVSCNVFTQARDLKLFNELQKHNRKYKIKEINGFDFFPQTKHVEGLVVLELI